MGGTVIYPDSQHFLDFAHLVALIRLHSVTVLHAVPVFFRELLEYVDMNQEWETMRKLRCIGTCGDAASVPVCQLIRTKLPQVELLNGYGPTEISVWSHTYFFTEDQVKFPVPIGRPVPGYTEYVLDDDGEPVPVGVLGRLFIGGSGVFRGYVNHPELTSKALARSDSVRGRLYDSGDLVRLRRDGELVFCGRADFQVKLRGQRLELGEIEVVLLSMLQ